MTATARALAPAIAVRVVAGGEDREYFIDAVTGDEALLQALRFEDVHASAFASRAAVAPRVRRRRAAATRALAAANRMRLASSRASASGGR